MHVGSKVSNNLKNYLYKTNLEKYLVNLNCQVNNSLFNYSLLWEVSYPLCGMEILLNLTLGSVTTARRVYTSNWIEIYASGIWLVFQVVLGKFPKSGLGAWQVSYYKTKLKVITEHYWIEISRTCYIYWKLWKLVSSLWGIFINIFCFYQINESYDFTCMCFVVWFELRVWLLVEVKVKWFSKCIGWLATVNHFYWHTKLKEYDNKPWILRCELYRTTSTSQFWNLGVESFIQI